ncbi:OmpA/MotB family protein [Enterococcus columbae]|uniref:OmpA-like domain-containing protein n=1 Tax=Enterococcus columbae DSM 7374 = ATCC 51263 TaxID=1121865 RepID=S1NSU9_9ENTE|nr:flagellar motor protein MotB [Enterococcus columbae]EOT39964.1 hypothetical protein OMW_01753 [Enterococcus columbae DSM 7374 = ATCC 51263]EOW83949.1 hypothetical protein I568_01396 [Enterococcus columbae DSM 7374 = ATCC 51263]OJG25832.1 hypothetical protein RR47_GL001338 [Enterococcus columbae DSM 7374 = ATCC 51263]
MKRKKKHEEHVDEAWLLPYSDMMTLLLALFIVLFAMAKVDTAKFNEFRSEFTEIFSGIGTSSGKAVIGNAADPNLPVKEQKTKESEEAKEAAVAMKLEDKQLAKLREQLEKSLDSTEIADDVSVDLKSDGIHIALSSKILFSSGSADLTDDVKKNLTIVGEHFKGLDQDFIIAGYTDNRPENGRYASNWELSAARAISVMNFFINNGMIASNKVSIQAYAENKPKATNSTDEGRSINRRVEIIIHKLYAANGQTS